MNEGQTFAHYKVLHRLGKGAMGIVCKAEDTRLNRFVALKFLPPDAITDALMREQLLAEARAASSLDHPNVCRIHHVEELEDGQIVLVMAFYDGETLARRIARGPLELQPALHIASQLLAGLHHAHEHGIVHRDVKPSNVMVNLREEVKIVDFGLANRPHFDQTIGNTSSMVGTTHYMSPEQITSKNIDHRADIWASGVVLYEMLSGEVPFTGKSQYRIFEAILHEKHRALRERRPELPEEIDVVVDRALAKDAMHRYRDALEFQDELLRMSAPSSGSSRITGSSRSSVSLSSLSEWQDKSILVLPFSSFESSGETTYFCDGLTDEIITDLSCVRSLRVICRTSAMQLKGTKDPAKKIARDLNVRYLLEGTVRMAHSAEAGKSSIRTTVKLVDPMNDSSLWTGKFSGTLEDVFTIQENIAREIVAALKVQLTPSEEQNLGARPIQNIQAYHYYLKAKHEFLNYSKEGMDRALEYLQMGSRLTGENALLLSAEGQVYWQYVNAGISSDPQYLVKARDCANRALRLEPESAHGLRLLGLISVQEGKSQEAVRLLKRSIAIDPNDSDTLSWYSAICGLSGKAEVAMPLARRVLEIDPLTPVYRFIPGLLSLMAGHYSEAVPPFDDAVKADPTNCMLRMTRGQILAMGRRKDDAVAEFRAMAQEFPENFFARLGNFFSAALTEDHESVPSILTEDLKQIAACDPHYAWNMAECFAVLGDTENSLEWLGIAIEKGFINYPMISTLDPLLKNIRGNEKFAVLAERARERWQMFEV